MSVQTAIGNLVQPVIEDTFTTCMEQLQEGYVGSVAATAGCLMEVVRRDQWGIDVRLIQTQGYLKQEEVIYAQLKNTTRVAPVNGAASSFSYRFNDRRHFEKLSMPRSTIKAILIVMTSPKQQQLWTSASHSSLHVSNCCYWVNLEGVPVPTTPSCDVPTANIFHATALTAMFARVSNGLPI